MIKKNIDKWEKCMRIGRWSGCHQMPERSFFFKKYQFPVCARCTGVLLGYILGLITCPVLCSFVIPIFCCLVMFIDWFVQYKQWKMSTNVRRFITGILGGYGIMIIQVMIVKEVAFRIFY
ncbi:MAG: DUF2085 domain-containing protein [Lachnospiraceae bacterium]